MLVLSGSMFNFSEKLRLLTILFIYCKKISQSYKFPTLSELSSIYSKLYQLYHYYLCELKV